jgi:hypothetical protein
MSRKLYWGNVMAQTDMGGLWIRAKIRPPLYWWLCRVKLFALIVWRRYDPQCTPMDWRTAWEVSKVAEGLPPCYVNRGPKP